MNEKDFDKIFSMYTRASISVDTILEILNRPPYEAEQQVSKMPHTYYIDLEKVGVEGLKEAFKAVENHDLKVYQVICSVCWRSYAVNDKNSVLCEHLREDLSWLDNMTQNVYKKRTRYDIALKKPAEKIEPSRGWAEPEPTEKMYKEPQRPDHSFKAQQKRIPKFCK
jgi:hypothetical protein